MEPAQLNRGILFDIQGYSVHDGPGCRTLLFFKGCPLDCVWCSNPEGIHSFQEPMWNSCDCMHDGLCEGACPGHAIQKGENEEIVIDRNLCRLCTGHPCVEACRSGALKVAGYDVTLDDMMRIIRRDRRFWGEGGGITLTGGEPFFQPGFARSVLEACYHSGIHTAVETCGSYETEAIGPSLPFLDWIFFDLKVHDPAVSSVSAQRIRETGMYLATHFSGRLVFRLPLIRGKTDPDVNLYAIRDFILRTGRPELNILPGHHLGREKWAKLGRGYYTTDFEPHTSDDVERMADIFRDAGITCWTGGETPF